jgi:hypothetical protein
MRGDNVKVRESPFPSFAHLLPVFIKSAEPLGDTRRNTNTSSIAGPFLLSYISQTTAITPSKSISVDHQCRNINVQKTADHTLSHPNDQSTTDL